MLNQFYNYLAKKVIEYFNSIEVKNGDRFDIQFEKEDEVKTLYDEIKEVADIKAFNYKAKVDGEEYETFSFKSGEIDIIVSATINGIQPDYLTKLRNEVGGSLNEKFINTAIIFIHNTTLDSIIGGATSFKKEGMPFHITSITSDIKVDLEKSTLKNSQRKIIELELEKSTSSGEDGLSLLQFEEILNVINKGSVEKEDYKNFRLFYDKQLDNFSAKEVEDRIRENAEVFSRVDSIHKFQGDIPSSLEKFLDEKGVENLSNTENWEEIDFSQVKTSIENKKKTKKVQYEGYELFNIEEENFWDKPEKETEAGKRKRRIIVFNPNKETLLKLAFKFDEKILQKEVLIDKGQEAEVKVSGKKVLVEINHEIGKASFNTIKVKASENYEFKIVVIDIDNTLFKNTELETGFSIAKDKRNKDNRIILAIDSKEFTINKNGEEEEFFDINNQDEDLLIDSVDSRITILNKVELNEDEDTVRFNLHLQGFRIPISIKDEGNIPVRISGFNVWVQKREENKDFKYINDRLIQGSRTYFATEEFRANLKREDKLIQDGSSHFIEKNDEMFGEDLDIPENLKTAYIRLVNYYKVNNLLPSLATYSKELYELSVEYINSFLEVINSLQEGGYVENIHKSLIKLGVLKIKGTEDLVLLTPLHPINVIYQILLQDELGNERLHESLLKKLDSIYLLPYITEEKELYKPLEQNHSKEWKYYVKNDSLKYKSTRKFVSKLVKEKIEEFVQHFSYLFELSTKSPIKLNLINTGDSKEVLQGIISYYVSELKYKKIDELKEIHVNIYSKDENSVFEAISYYETVKEIEEKLNLDLEPLRKNYLKEDVLSLCREKIKFYRKDINSEKYDYCHVAFYEMNSNIVEKDSKLNDMISGASLNGITSGVPSRFINDSYRTGFGTKYDNSEKSTLLNIASKLNALYKTVQFETTFTMFECRTTAVSNEDKENLDKIYNSSNWVTFIDPKVDLKFFKNDEKNKDLLIIHYSDQYTSSSGYDAITVTIKSEQYELIIKEFLKDKDINVTDESTIKTINCFNAVNGDWLLRLISDKGQFPREKISIISAIKLSLAYFYHKDIVWIPISLEEVLRVSKGAGLSGADGLFSVKNLKGDGQYSDDLLLIGVEVQNKKVKVHYYPVEVKIGENTSTVLNKAKKQAYKTRNYLEKHLIESSVEEDIRRFAKKMYRNFMMQLAIVSAEKMKLYDVWKEQNWDLIIDSDVRRILLNDEYEISNDLDEKIGRGAVISFKKGISFNDEAKFVEITKEELDSDIVEEEFCKGNKFLQITFGESQGYNNIINDTEEIKNLFISGASDFERDKLLVNIYKVPQKGEVTEINKIKPLADNDFNNSNYNGEDKKSNTENGQVSEDDEGYMGKSASENEVVNISQKIMTEIDAMVDTSTEYLKETKDGIRVLLGSSKGKDIYWEFGNKGLGNRHLLISGKSGQGKTYFIQCLLLELSRKGVPSIIFDYTDGFKNSKLEPEFKEFVGDNLIQFIVAKDKFPINPFKRNRIELDENDYIDEDNSDIGERIKSVIGSVYKLLKIQQLNAIYQATIRGVDKHGDKMNFISLRSELEDDNTGFSKTALGQLNPLIDKNPFDNTKEFNWKDILNSDGKVFIIQLTGFTRDVQLIITELILWDLWHFTVQNGSKDKPFSVILDEAQNLDFGDNSPYTRILTEGRKFGWSGWFATQFLKGQMNTSEINRLQNAAHKIYFAPPDEEIPNIANALSTNVNEKKDLERELMRLQKGECISFGPSRSLDNILRNSVYKVKISSLLDRNCN